jgi:hypothetical protein
LNGSRVKYRNVREGRSNGPIVVERGGILRVIQPRQQRAQSFDLGGICLRKGGIVWHELFS